jgi:RimJ/RimL family protein N-acetyltransferase
MSGSNRRMVTMEKEVELTNGSVLLRPYRPSDVDSLYEAVWESMTELSLWMPWCHADYSKEESRAWIESCVAKWTRGAEYNFVITDAKEVYFLGGCGLNRVSLSRRLANLGYWVRSRCTGKGVATASARLVAHFGFDELELSQIKIAAAISNEASLRVAEKIGATRGGILRDRFVIDDTVYDAAMFSLIPQDLRKVVGNKDNT